MGMANAAVLPVPVWAHPNKSLRSNTMGIDCSWIGVGVVYPSCSSAFNMGSMRCNCSNNKIK